MVLAAVRSPGDDAIATVCVPWMGLIGLLVLDAAVGAVGAVAVAVS